MKLRKLELKDAKKMLEWMYDDSVVHFMGIDFTNKSISDCRSFIEASQNDSNHLHLAIVNDDDEYMGTVSLKNIDKINLCAELAIIIGKDAMGKGYSKYGIHEIVRMGLEDIGLKQIYWYVSPQNKRAVKFYDKNGYIKISDVPGEYRNGKSDEEVDSFYWYIAR